MQMADVKPSIISWLIVGLMAVTFIVALKVVDQRWPIPGLHQLLTVV
jgi:hypothetical protein